MSRKNNIIRSLRQELEDSDKVCAKKIKQLKAQYAKLINTSYVPISEAKKIEWLMAQIQAWMLPRDVTKIVFQWKGTDENKEFGYSIKKN